MFANRWPWVALGVGAYVAFALASLPAGTVYRWFVPDTVQLAGISGTLWSGSAAAGSIANVPVQDLRWRVRPLPLFVFRISGDVDTRLADGFVRARVSASPSRVRLSDVQASTSLGALRDVLPVRGMRGLASASFETLELTNGWPTAAVGELSLGQLEAPGFVPSGRQELIQLGDYLMQLQQTDGEGIRGAFSDTGGPLEVSGTLSLAPDGAYTLDGLIRPRPGAADDLVQGLQIMTGEPDAGGRRRLTLTGSL
jgi:general secretion pathway protein N